MPSEIGERGVELSLTQKAKSISLRAGFDPVYGARPLKRALYDVVEDRLAELILEDKVVEGSRVEFDVVDGEVVVGYRVKLPFFNVSPLGIMSYYFHLLNWGRKNHWRPYFPRN